MRHVYILALSHTLSQQWNERSITNVGCHPQVFKICYWKSFINILFREVILLCSFIKFFRINSHYCCLKMTIILIIYLELYDVIEYFEINILYACDGVKCHSPKTVLYQILKS